MSRNAPAHEVADHDAPNRYEAGAYHFVYYHEPSRKVGIVHGCPCGCGSSTLLYFRGAGIDPKHEWDVEGEWPNVTLKPSIGIKNASGESGYHWHGFLENGVFVER
jgi:hypothetical protein